MPRFVSNDETKVIRAPWWDEDETVTIKRLTYGDRQKVSKAAVRMRFDGDGKPLDTELGDINLTIMQLAIVSWTFTRAETGKPVPCNRFWFERLTEEDGDFILSEINAFNPTPQRTEAEAEEFRGVGGDGDPEQ